jgi:hypothetical protein
MMSSEQSMVPGGGEALSALVDGELMPDDVRRACAVWRNDARTGTLTS